MAVVATGSVAYDYILSFDGRFADHILADKAHVLNLSFLVERMVKRKGGVAANYAYSLQLLGRPAAILSAVGADGAEYRDWLAARGIGCAGLRVYPDEHTTTGFTTVDRDDNQITGYYSGAMRRTPELGLADAQVATEAVIVGPNTPAAMARLAEECRQAAVPFVYDPSHQLPQLSREELESAARGAWILIGNDYELEVIRERTRRSPADLLELCENVVTTLGRHGSRLETRAGSLEVGTAKPVREVDPVGAGDAYRSGLVHALLAGCSVRDAARVGSVTASYVVEQAGTIEHSFTPAEFAQRYQAAFGDPLPPGL